MKFLARFRVNFPWRAALGFGAMVALALLLGRVPAIRDLLARAPQWGSAPFAPLWFVLLAAPYCAFGLPRQALCLAAGVAFGAGEALALCSLAYVAGALLTYGWARLLAPRSARDSLRGLLETRFAAIGAALSARPFRAVLTLRLLPVGSAMLVSAASGLLEVPLRAFILATLLGGLPQNAVFALVGAGARIGHAAQLALAVILFLVSAILGMRLLRSQDRPDRR